MSYHKNTSSKQQKSYKSIYESNKRSRSGSKRSIKHKSPDKKSKGPIRPPSRRKSYDGNQYGYKISEKLGYQKPTRNSSRREKYKSSHYHIIIKRSSKNISSKLPPIKNSQKIKHIPPPVKIPAYSRQKSRSKLQDNRQNHQSNYKRSNSKGRVYSGQQHSSNHPMKYEEYILKQKEHRMDLIGRYDYPVKDQLQKKRDEAKQLLRKAYRSRVSSADIDKVDPQPYYYKYGNRPAWWN